MGRLRCGDDAMWGCCFGGKQGVALACANISKLIPRPGHSDMLRAWVYYEAKRSLNQKKCLSLVLFSLKTAF